MAVKSAGFGTVRTRVVTYGSDSAPPLLLVHGLMTSSYSWRYLLEPLGSRFRIYVPDLPGCGRSEPTPRRSHSASALAGFIGDLQEQLGIEGCSAIGNSLGGYLCMQRELQAPRSFNRLVVLHAPALPQARLPEVARGAREYGEPLATEAGAESFIRYMADALDPAEMTRFVAELERRRDQGQQFPVPLMLIYAREDPMVRPEIGPKLHRLVPEAEFRWIAQSSHFAHVDSPDEIAALAGEFLQSPT